METTTTVEHVHAYVRYCSTHSDLSMYVLYEQTVYYLVLLQTDAPPE